MSQRVDVVLRGGEIFDGSGAPGREGDVAISGRRIVGIGDVGTSIGRLELDCRGLAIAPGFINMLSWATESLLVDGRAESDLRQGVTLEVFGEGESMGPLTPAMRERLIAEQGDLCYDVEWTTLAEYLATLEARGVSPNVGSLVGATTVRVHSIGYAQRSPRPAELATMVSLVDAAMAEGALGVGSSLIYAPAASATTAELVALAGAAGRRGGMYASHLRSESNGLAVAVSELVEIATRARTRAEIYHFKALGPAAETAFDEAVRIVEDARGRGLPIGADVYPYAASGTGLDAAMPPWVQEGGREAWFERLRDPTVRQRLVGEMRAAVSGWENHLALAGSADRVLLAKFDREALQPLAGRTLGAVARARGVSPEDAAIDLVLEDGSRVEVVYFNQAESVVRRALSLPWVAIGSDAPAPSTRQPFLRAHPHPRAYGTFARVLGRYVGGEQLVALPEAIRRMTGLPAGNLRLRDRGRLAVGNYADVVAFDPALVTDRATYEAPHQYATGVVHVLVNGAHTIAQGAHTGARAGLSVRRRGGLHRVDHRRSIA